MQLEHMKGKLQAQLYVALHGTSFGTNDSDVCRSGCALHVHW